MIPEDMAACNTVFLALVMWREARGEGEACILSVGFSIMNRVLNPKWWGDSVMSVVTKKWQYSSMTDPHDQQLTTWPSDNDPWWAACIVAAKNVLCGYAPNPVLGADSYYDVSIPPPAWAEQSKFVAQIGRIRFYDLDGDHPQNEGKTA